MFGSRIKLDNDLFDRCKKHATEMGYSSVEEFIAHALEKELKGSEMKDESEKEERVNRLKGLGYID